MSANLSKADYKFVVGANVDAEHPYGDMDRLKTSFTGGSKGVIMPYRSGNDKYIVSGEDICFLSEGAMDRSAAMGDVFVSPPSNVPFSRSIKAGDGNADNFNATPSWVAAVIQRLAADRLGNHHGFIKSMMQDKTYDLKNSEVVELYHSSDMESSVSDFSEGHRLSSSSIEKLFNDEKKLDVACALLIGDQEGSVDVEYTDAVPDYPGWYDPIVETSAIFSDVEWSGGYPPDPLQPEAPAHRHGYLGISYRDLYVYSDIQNLPDSLDIGQGDVWINCNIIGSYNRTSYSGHVFRKIGNWLRVGNRLQCTISGSTFKTILMDYIQDKCGISVGPQLLNGYTDGSFWLQMIDEPYWVYQDNIWFTVPIIHTKWWS